MFDCTLDTEQQYAISLYGVPHRHETNGNTTGAYRNRAKLGMSLRVRHVLWRATLVPPLLHQVALPVPDLRVARLRLCESFARRE